MAAEQPSPIEDIGQTAGNKENGKRIESFPFSDCSPDMGII